MILSANSGRQTYVDLQNAGLKALDEIASGGEMSRVMLALKVAVEENAGKPQKSESQKGRPKKKITPRTLVFDEIDIGIGGRAAEAVGQKLKSLARGQQVLCVTHLPQVAAQGHSHLRVSKHSEGNSTHTRIEALNTDGRRDELARMLGGVEITRETRAHAKQMLERAQTA